MGSEGSFSKFTCEMSKELEINDDILCRIDLLKSLQESFECRRCGECCKQESIAFTEKDILRAAHKKGISASEFIDKYDLGLINNSGDLVYYRLPVGKIGACPFCSDHECTIYDARPQVCRGFPFLTPENVQNAFKMNNVIKLSGNCKAAIDQVKTVFGIEKQMDEKEST